MAIEAYVMIETIVGKTRKVANSLSKVAQVKAVDIVAGPVDIIIKLETVDMTAIGEVVFNEIHAIPGISRTITCLSFCLDCGA